MLYILEFGKKQRKETEKKKKLYTNIKRNYSGKQKYEEYFLHESLNSRRQHKKETQMPLNNTTALCISDFFLRFFQSYKNHNGIYRTYTTKLFLASLSL